MERRGIMRDCGICRKQFYVPPRKFGSAKYCSIKCNGAANGRRERKLTVTEFLERMAGTPGCWEWPLGRDTEGYGRTRHNGKGARAHRVAYEITKGPLGDLDALHTCDNPPCCRPDHLYAGTNLDNVADCVARGRHGKGAKNGNTKLSEAAVAVIRSRKLSIAVSSAAFGISATHVKRIRQGRAWSA